MPRENFNEAENNESQDEQGGEDNVIREGKKDPVGGPNMTWDKNAPHTDPKKKSVMIGKRHTDMDQKGKH